MTPERWARLNSLFNQALDHVNPDAFLDQACIGDPDLRRRAGNLLARHHAEADPEPIIPARFRVLSHVGSGTFGDVYKVVEERDGSRPLALKVLREASPAALLYFKREFRTAAGLHHSNLVEMYELIADGRRWMFTMEFIDGPQLLEYLRAGSRAWDSARETRIRATLPKLAEALTALHSKGLLHRDLKPANILVGAGDRLVLLDFGLVRAFDDESRTVAGTPDYMSPEQARGEPLTEASDWYGAGVILYEAITGAKPFNGPPYDVLNRKQHEDPPPPRQRVPDVPPDLNEVCVALLSRDKDRRLAAARSLHGQALMPSIRRQDTGIIFCGRRDELNRLHDAFRLSSEGITITHVFGPSGIGKSSLLRQFVTELRHEHSPLVFAGRCYESEYVPYQGIDDLIDGLATHLRHLPEHELEQVLPRNFHLAVRLFPVLGNVSSQRGNAPIPPDSSELRSRAFAAIREMLGRLAERRDMVLIIDDLQWGDLDASEFLRDLTEAPDAPRLLLVLAYRSEDITTLPWLQDFRSRHQHALLAPRTRFIGLGPLSPDETEELAHIIAGSDVSRHPERIRTLVKESGGDPFLAHEIARALADGDSEARPASLDEILKKRLITLSPAAGRLLELVAVAATPLESDVLKAAFDDDITPARLRLVSDRLLRQRIVEGRHEVEVYHDRIRSAITQGLSDGERLLRNRELAEALESSGHLDPERLTLYWQGAGEPRKSALYARQAAARAAQALAFNKAAQFYRMALEQDPETDRGELYRGLGRVLSSAGLGLESAEAFLKAADHFPDHERWRLFSLAASQFIRTGQLDRGSRILDAALRGAGIGLIRGTVHAISALAYFRFRLLLRGSNFILRSAEELNSEQILHLDLHRIAALTLGIVDPFRSAAFAVQYLLLALEAGVPAHLAFALSGVAAQLSLTSRSRRKAHDFLGRASRLADLAGESEAIAFVRLMKGIVAYSEANWRTSQIECEAAAEMFRTRCSGIAWELTIAITFAFLNLGTLGEWAELKRRVPALIRDAQSRGDLHQWLRYMLICTNWAFLAADQPHEALAYADAGSGAWPSERYNMQLVLYLLVLGNVQLYLKKPAPAWLQMEHQWKSLTRSRLLFVFPTSIMARFARARLAIAMALQCESTESRSFLKLARQETRRLRFSGVGWGAAFAALLYASLATMDRDWSEAGRQLALAVPDLHKVEWRAFHMVALHRLSQLEPKRDDYKKEVQDWVTAQEIRNPDAIFDMLLPGNWSMI